MEGLSRWLTWTVLLVAMIVFGWWECAHLGVYQYTTSYYPLDEADDWRYTACSRLVAQGYPLFTQVFSAQPPLLFYSLAAGMRVWGENLQGAQTVELAFGFVGFLSAIGIARLLAGNVGAAITGVVLAVSPVFLVYSHTVDAEGPMMAMSSLAILFAVVWQRRLSAFWLVLSGLALASAILLKLFALETVAPILCLVFLQRRDFRQFAANAVAFSASTLLPVVVVFGLISPREQWDQVIAMHDRAASLVLSGTLSAPELFLKFLQFDPGAAVMAIGGLSILWLCRHRDLLSVFLLWLAGDGVMLALFRPLFPHHLAILIIPLAVVGGVGAGVALQGKWTWRRPGSLVLAAAIALFVTFTPSSVRADRHVLVLGPRASAVRLATLTQRLVHPGRMVAADDLAVADLADRSVPPPLCDPSNVRLRSGYLTSNTLIKATRAYNAQAVVSSFGIYAQVPAYLRWVDQHYRVVPNQEGAKVYVLTTPQ